uniref:Fibrocystin-L n=1 Tax=Magallana gigas TaxID=29159 RepID=K1QFR0_MAGGI
MLISGTGFSQNKLSEGNQVQLVSLATSYDCPVSKDGTMESMIMCYTVPGMKEGVYYVRVIVDGVPIPDENMCQPEGLYSVKCRFEVRKQNTPLIQSVSPTSFSPGPESVIALGGMIFTDRYGTNVPEGSNGKEETVNQVFAGPLTCELRKTNDELYELQLDSPSSNMGQIKCRYQGTYIGNSNASFIIGDGPYGRSCRQLDTLLVSINKQIYQFQTFPEITGVTPSSGSTDGGTDLTIAGNYFTGTMENTEVYIGGKSSLMIIHCTAILATCRWGRFMYSEECKVTSVTSTEIQCTSPPQPVELPTNFCGNRGLLLEVWTSGTKLYTELADIETLTSSDTGYSEQLIGQSSFSHPETNYVSRTRGSFIAPYSGEYLFMIKSADASSLRLSMDGDPANKVEIAKCESTCPEYGSSPSQTSGRVVLTESQKYYMEVLHSYGSSGSPLVQVAARYFDTELTNQSTGIVNMEHQLVKVTSTVVREVQKVKIEVVPIVGSQRNEYQIIEVTELSGGTSDATYRLGLYGVYTEPFTSTSTSTDFRRAFENLPWYMNGGDTVGVQITHSTSAEVKVTIEIQFFTGRGDIPTLEFLQADGSQGEKLYIQIREMVKGIPSPYTFAMQMEGIISPLITPSDDVNAKPRDLVETENFTFIMTPSKKGGHIVLLLSVCLSIGRFETNEGNSGGEWMNDREAFCGRGLVKNPTYLYLDNGGFNLQGTVNTICFGYHGAIQDTLTFKYTYMDETMTLIENNYKSFTISIGEESDEWKYTCFDILSALSSFTSNGQSFKIQYIELSRAGDVFVDEVYIGQGPSTLDQENVNLLRMKPVMPNGHRIHYTQGADTTVPPVYSVDITFFPLECGHDFPLLSVVPEQTNALKVEVERLSAASPPVTGTFTLTFEGQESVAISPSVTGEELKEILMTSVPNMGEVYTYRHGDCANFDLSIAFLSRPAGSDIVITGSGLSANVEDITVKIKSADCTVIAASETEITCTPSPQTPPGNQPRAGATASSEGVGGKVCVQSEFGEQENGRPFYFGKDEVIVYNVDSYK